ncbi:MAG: hypothetical protein GF418_15305 [Chitinivibrionales bacterium]|nr:hypothetical protein [Chitinivibrionales bacterium]MBD3396989.1 hypothetical protein [Chitinivibrionales bacterium]
MGRMRFFTATVLFSILARSAFAADCPEWVQFDATIDNAADAPAGWFVFVKYDQDNEIMPGIYKSDNQDFNPQVIPNTESDEPLFVQATNDGEWLLYMVGDETALMTAFTAYLIKPDGTGKTEVPMPQCEVSGSGFSMPDLQFPRTAGIYRNSPLGSEIAYMASYQKMRAIEVDLSGDTPSFPNPGQGRLVIDLSNAGIRFAQNLGRGGAILALNGSHYQGAREHNSPYGQSNMFVTIPDNGEGTADGDDIWHYDDVPDNVRINGCGFSLSPTGDRAAWNIGRQGGDSSCFSCRIDDPSDVSYSTTQIDHKGFLVSHFMEPDEPSLGRTEYVLEKGISMNWVPRQFRFGKYNEVNWTDWNWPHEEYVVGILQGDLATQPGVWLCKWQTNEWFPIGDLAGTGTKARSPAIHISGIDRAKDVPLRYHRPREATGPASMYTARGELVHTAAARKLPRGVYVVKSGGRVTTKLVP